MITTDINGKDTGTVQKNPWQAIQGSPQSGGISVFKSVHKRTSMGGQEVKGKTVTKRKVKQRLLLGERAAVVRLP